MVLAFIPLLALALAQTAREVRAEKTAARHSTWLAFQETEAGARAASSPFDRSTAPEERIPASFYSYSAGSSAQ